MQAMCKTCGGIGSVPDEKLPGSTLRCKDCGGTGLARAAKPETGKAKAKTAVTGDHGQDARATTEKEG
jgi:DnaJ-class molecular chaperone